MVFIQENEEVTVFIPKDAEIVVDKEKGTIQVLVNGIVELNILKEVM